jgi:hypothetical protein
MDGCINPSAFNTNTLAMVYWAFLLQATWPGLSEKIGKNSRITRIRLVLLC